MSDLNSRVRKLAYIVPGGGGGAPLELFDPRDLEDFITTEIIAELERLSDNNFKFCPNEGAIKEILNARIKELKEKS